MVGMALTPRLIAEGYEVSVMVRPSSDRSTFEQHDVRIVEADLADPDSLEQALREIDFVVHAAAHVGDWGPAEKYRQRNVVALEYLLTAARRHHLRRWIQISSLGIYAAQDHYGTDETVPPDLGGLDGYTRTKAEAEVVLQRHIREHQFPAVILRPGFVYGPGDRHVLPRIIKRFQAGKMKLIGDGQKVLNNTSVDNLADAVVLALEHPNACGETFNIRDQRLVTRQEFVSTIADSIGAPYPKSVPVPIARMLVVIVEGLAKLRGATEAPFVTRASIKFLAQNLDFSIDKAKRVLGYAPRDDFQDVMQRALQWARSAESIEDKS
jgi:nucleoside-diphosphate-sugar epimerase